jgi:hypothetical protein
MMLWIPIVFVCLAGAQCGFVYDTATYTEEKCIQALSVMQNDFDRRPEVTAHQGSCVPVSYT